MDDNILIRIKGGTTPLLNVLKLVCSLSSQAVVFKKYIKITNLKIELSVVTSLKLIIDGDNAFTSDRIKM